MSNTVTITPKLQRNSAIELLRIISMLLIVFHHYVYHGGFEFINTDFGLNSFWCKFIAMGGKVGVNIFVLISGYFLITATGKLFNLKRIFKIWFQVEFFSVLLYLVSVITGVQSFGIASLIKSLFPITFTTWWFASAYFVMYLLHPFINIFLTSLDKKTFQKLIILMVALWSVIPTFLFSGYQSNDLIWFICLYSISAYIRLHGIDFKLKTKHLVTVTIIGFALIYLSFWAMLIVGTKIDVFAKYWSHFASQNSVLVLAVSLSIFIIFTRIKLGYCKWINIIASGAFGVYLLHDSAFGRLLFWHKMFRNASLQSSYLLIPHSIVAVILVFGICTAIDLVRQKLIEKPVLLLPDRASKKENPKKL